MRPASPAGGTSMSMPARKATARTGGLR
jgi:hypothetical protein